MAQGSSQSQTLKIIQPVHQINALNETNFARIEDSVEKTEYDFNMGANRKDTRGDTLLDTMRKFGDLRPKRNLESQYKYL